MYYHIAMCNVFLGQYKNSINGILFSLVHMILAPQTTSSYESRQLALTTKNKSLHGYKVIAQPSLIQHPVSTPTIPRTIVFSTIASIVATPLITYTVATPNIPHLASLATITHTVPIPIIPVATPTISHTIATPHKQNKRYKCLGCSKLLMFEQHCISHVISHLQNNSLECSVCNESLINMGSSGLREHILREHIGD